PALRSTTALPAFPTSTRKATTPPISPPTCWRRVKSRWSCAIPDMSTTNWRGSIRSRSLARPSWRFCCRNGSRRFWRRLTGSWGGFRRCELSSRLAQKLRQHRLERRDIDGEVRFRALRRLCGLAVQRKEATLFQVGQIPEKIVLHERRGQSENPYAARRKHKTGQARAAIADDQLRAGEYPQLIGER